MTRYADRLNRLDVKVNYNFESIHDNKSKTTVSRKKKL